MVIKTHFLPDAGPYFPHDLRIPEFVDRLERALRTTLALRDARDAWDPPIVRTVATRGEGVEALSEAIGAHRTYCEQTGIVEAKRRSRAEERVRDLVARRLEVFVWKDGPGESTLAAGLDEIERGTSTPYAIAERIVAAAGIETRERTAEHSIQ